MTDQVRVPRDGEALPERPAQPDPGGVEAEPESPGTPALPDADPDGA